MKTSRLFGLLALTLQLVCLRAEAAASVAVWTNRYNGSANNSDYASAVAVDRSGNVFVTGRSLAGNFSYDYATVAYSGAGAPRWTNRFNGPVNGNDSANAMAVDANGNVFVTGDSEGGGSDYDYTTIKYSEAGVPLWTNRYNGPGNSSDSARAVVVDGSGNVFVTGESYAGGGANPDYATVAYSSAGLLLWVNRYNGPANSDDLPYAVAVDGNGNVFVTGKSLGSGSSYDYATVAYSGGGVPLWTNRYNGPGSSFDYANAVAVDKNEDVFVTGQSRQSAGENYDYATIKYSGAGVPLWTNRYNGPGNKDDSARSLALDGSGNVIVTGDSIGSGTFPDYATITYSGAGAPLWTNRYDGPVNSSDIAYAVAVDGSGNVFVTGESFGDTVNDYATIKYATPPAPLPSGVVTWWRAESNALDSVGSNHGTLQGGAGFAAGKGGQAFSFNGSSRVLVGTPAALNPASITIEGWINLFSVTLDAQGSPFSAILTKWAQDHTLSPGADSYGLWTRRNEAGDVQLFGALHLSDGTEPVLQGGIIPLNTFTHVAMTFDATTGSYALYVNGQVVASRILAALPIFATSANAVIGAEDDFTLRYFNGLIDELTVYGRALSPAELQAIYTAGSAGKAASGTAYLWNGNSGDWFTAANWSPAGVPGSNDTVVITSGTVDVSAAATVANLTLGASVLLDGAGTLTVLGAAHWTGGFMLGSGATVIAPGATLTISGDDEKRLMTRRLDNYGTATWSGARIAGQNGPVINNHVGALFDIQTDATLYDSYGGELGTLNNFGTLRKSAGTNINYFSGTLASSGGTLDVRTGTVQPVTTAALTNTTFTGAGRFLLNGAAVTLAGTVTIAPGANFEFASGTLTGTHTILGTLNWTGGILDSPGTTTVPTNSVLLVTGDTEKRLRRQLDNYGTVTWSGARITGENGPVVNNFSNALFDLQTDANLFESYGGAVGVFNNSGTLRKSAGTGTNSITGTLNDSGTMDVQTGVLQLVGLLNLNTSSLTGAGGLLVNEATLMLNGTVTVASGTGFEFAAGTFGGTGTISGTLNWTGGTMDAPGTTTIATNGVLAISGVAEKLLRGRQLENHGTVTWSGARITGQDGPAINNLVGAIFDIQADATLFESYGGVVGTLNNSGTLRRSVGTNTATVHGVFTNTGTVELHRGTLTVVGDYSPGVASALRLLIGGTAPGIDYGQLQVSGTAALAGTLMLTRANGFVPATNQTFTILNAGSLAGNFFGVTGAQIAGGIFFRPLYQPDGVMLEVRDGTPRMPAQAVIYTNGQFRLQFSGVDGQAYVVEASTNLRSPTNWVPITTNILSGGGLAFTNANAASFSNRFFRAVFLP